ncbi:hypothetical protein TRFO_13183 [Tritrichomonas foetus]|uniref:Uncharacterized protein n=1 Tax=Tritrichomonas foetus TaxID=1144522 RepID=A0A1J4KZ96_9EUKA|nr:hypothetical protein TRFO_13183 [Tritrichomonas foetus]|eukprot:OHT16575.1 hypothetical protein TRFO_13183 [Tritrichomonas foetus]
MNDLKSLSQSFNSCFDSFIRNLPDSSSNKSNIQDKIHSYHTTILQIINGKGQALWESLDQEIDKKLENIRSSNIDLKSKQGRLGASLIKAENESKETTESGISEINVLQVKVDHKETAIDNINAEILQLEAENEALAASPLPVIKPPPTAERNARISLKQKQQEVNSASAEYEKMKRDYFIQIQQCSQGIEKSKHEVEVLEMQLNSLLSRISLMNRAGTFNKRSHFDRQNEFREMENRHAELEKLDMASKYPPYKKQDFHSNNSALPQLKLSQKYDISGSNVCLVGERDFQIEETRQTVSEPRNDLKKHAFAKLNLSKHQATNAANEGGNENENHGQGKKDIRSVKIEGEKTIHVELPSQPNSGRSPIRRIPTPCHEKDRTDECLNQTQAAIKEADDFLAELSMTDLLPAQTKSESSTKQNDDNKMDVKEPEEPKETSHHRSPPPVKKKPPQIPPKKKDGPISFLPISEEEVKKVARPLTCNEENQPRRIQISKKKGYEIVFFHIAERIPKVC